MPRGTAKHPLGATRSGRSEDERALRTGAFAGLSRPTTLTAFERGEDAMRRTVLTNRFLRLFRTATGRCRLHLTEYAHVPRGERARHRLLSALPIC